jgi:ComF family protein
MRAIFFPDVCVGCGHATVSAGRLICVFCLDGQLTPAAPDADLILPADVSDCRSAWQFDKHGTLQVLLHALKYRGLGAVGLELGHAAARRLSLPPAHFVPVPLHPGRQRDRGYNQARLIAEGMAAAAGGEVVEDGAVVRARKTRTQTGFDLLRREENIREAFTLSEPEAFRGRHLCLVDDVMTTGATLFELARCLRQADPASITLATLARA